jgi:hypothetical protein
MLASGAAKRFIPYLSEHVRLAAIQREAEVVNARWRDEPARTHWHGR